MFFFIGIIMILVQGGYSRRISGGKEVRIAVMVCHFHIVSFLAPLDPDNQNCISYSRSTWSAFATYMFKPVFATLRSFLTKSPSKKCTKWEVHVCTDCLLAFPTQTTGRLFVRSLV